MTKTFKRFQELPSTGYVRQSQLIGGSRRSPNSHEAELHEPGILPFSSPTLWRMVKAGTFPSPVKLSERVTAWRVEDIREWMSNRSAERGAP
jgi:predicted DNA-binding transcriptional regulator AlpA